MKLSVYRRVSKMLSRCRSRRDIEKLAADHDFEGIPLETLISIYCQELQGIMRKAFHHHNYEVRKRHYHKSFFERTQAQENQVILHMAKELDLSPCMLMRFILDVHMEENDAKPKLRARTITELLRNPHKAENASLACAINEAVCGDDIYGPFADKIRRTLGMEFEEHLQRWCKEQNLGFLTEEDMRKQGFDKTPDIKLTVPVALDGFVVNWIESKAMFGNEECHTKHVKEQVGPYTRRFGPGIVIYWFGFIDALDCQRSNGIALCEGLPKKVQRIDLREWRKHPDWEFPKPAVF